MLEINSDIGLDRVLENTRCGFCVWDNEYKIIHSNKYLAGWFDLKPHEMVGHPVTDFFSDPSRDRGQEELEKINGGDNRMRVSSLQYRDGPAIQVLVIPPPQITKGRDVNIGGAGFIVDCAEIRAAGVDTQSLSVPLPETLNRVADELRAVSRAIPLSSPPAVPVNHPNLAGLSPREHDVLNQLVNGLRVASIAEALGVADSTVRNHLKAMYRKLEVGSQQELIELVRSLRPPI
jgi:DNA-binding CsgD family transcriptional regulator